MWVNSKDPMYIKVYIYNNNNDNYIYIYRHPGVDRIWHFPKKH